MHSSQPDASGTDNLYRALFEAAPDAIFLVDGDTILDANPAAVRLVRATSKEELLAYSVRDFWPSPGETDPPSIDAWFREAYEQGVTQYTTRRYRMDGTPFDVEITLSRVDLPDGPILQGLVRDVTRERAIERNRDQLVEIIEATPDIIRIADPEGRILYQNPGAQKALTEPGVADLKAAHPPWARQKLETQALPAVRETGLWKGETAFLGPDAAEIPVIQTVVGHFDSQGTLQRVSDIAQDISERKRTERELEYMATHDRLTGVANRARLYDLLDEALAELRRYATPFTLVMLDVDHFKRINDRLGHHAGDHVLQSLVQCVSTSLRVTDKLGRWGGEEFLVLARHTGEVGAIQLAERILSAVTAEPMPEAGPVTVSLGVAEASPDDSLHALEQRVDWALLAAKEGGRAQIQTLE